MGLADSVFRLFRENSDVVPLKRLEKRGVKNVTVLDWNRVQALIEKAVDEALAKRGVDLAPHVLQNVHRDAKEAFHRLVAERDRLEETTRTLAQEKDDLARNVEALKSEILRSQQELATERDRAVRFEEVVVEGAQLDHAMVRLEARVRELIGDGQTGDLAAKVAAVARSLLDEEKKNAFDEAAAEQRRKVEQLERRLAKLQRALTDSESVIETLKSAKTGDPGIESVYKSVQGLDRNDSRAEQKRGLLDQVFRLNLELREVMGERAASSRGDRPTEQSKERGEPT
jgi:phage shock protein A